MIEKKIDGKEIYKYLTLLFVYIQKFVINNSITLDN